MDNKDLYIWGDYNEIEKVNDIYVEPFMGSKSIFVAEVDNRLFLVMSKKINGCIKRKNNESKQAWNASNSAKTVITNRTKYGGENSFIVDMQGIKNFINATCLDFKDYYIRAILIKIGFIREKNYLRVGVSGAPNIGIHPGGEVFEEQIVNGKNGGGISNSYSGYLLTEDGYSKGITLGIDGKMLENRMVYSHTAFLEQSTESRTIYKRIVHDDNHFELMEHIKSFAKEAGFGAFASQVLIMNDTNAIRIKGRVLKRRPNKAFKELSEATEIGNEKEFQLYPGQRILIAGTYYNRKDADWYKFTNGHEYERNGHYHAHILNDCKEIQHEVFHLRELKVNNKATIHLLITPIDHVVKITPLEKIADNYICPITGKNIERIIEEYI